MASTNTFFLTVTFVLFNRGLRLIQVISYSVLYVQYLKLASPREQHITFVITYCPKLTLHKFPFVHYLNICTTCDTMQYPRFRSH